MTELTKKQKEELMDIYIDLRNEADGIQKGMMSNDEMCNWVHSLADRLWSAMPDKFNEGDTVEVLPDIFNI